MICEDRELAADFYKLLYHAKTWVCTRLVCGLELDEGGASSLSTHRHHIFPKAFLNKIGLNEKNEKQKNLLTK